MFDLDSQASDIKDADFWSEVVEDIDVPEFVESPGPTYQLPFDANPLQFFMVIFPLALVQIIVDNTNLYAAQSVDQGWVDYNYRRDKSVPWITDSDGNYSAA